MTTKPAGEGEGPATYRQWGGVAGKGLMADVSVCGEQYAYATLSQAKKQVEIINKALAPLVARAELADRMAEALRYYKEAWKEVVNNPHHLNTGCGVCIVDRGMMAHQILVEWDVLAAHEAQGKGEKS